MKLVEIFHRIDEGRKEQFMAMMPASLQEIKSTTGQLWKDKWADEVNWALRTLKKQDRIVWYLRFAKAVMLSYLINFTGGGSGGGISNYGSDVIQKGRLDLAKKELQKFERMFSEPTIDLQIKRLNLTTLKSHLEHFLSLNLPGIEKIVWGKQDPKELEDEMAEVEKEWKEARKSTIPHHKISDTTTKLIEFPNGWQWVNLNAPTCSIEGQAMGHCGNQAAGNASETILSLREPVQGGWKPNLTFILNKRTGLLGEMKGRNNDKPAEKYHPYILKLLELPMIKGIAGGGYAPERNFSVNDLTTEQQEELFSKKPRMASLNYRYRKFGISQELLDDMDSIIKHSTDLPMPEFSGKLGTKGAFILGEQGIKWFADRDSSFDYYYKLMDTGFIDDIHISDDDAKNFLESLPENIYDKIKESGIEYDELEPELRRAAYQGYNSGTMEEIYKAIEKFLQYPLDYDKVRDVDSILEGNSMDHWRVVFYLEPQIVFAFIDDHELYNIGDWAELYEFAIKDFEDTVPQNGFWDYDKKAALEYFLEEHPEFAPEKKKE